MFCVDVAKFLRTAFLLNMPGGCFWQSYGKVSWGACSLISTLHVLSIIIKNSRNVAQLIFYYHMTKQFLPCLNWLVTCFQLQNMFWKNNCFWFWWKDYTKHCTNNCVISPVKILSFPSYTFQFQFQGMIWKMQEYILCNQKYCI